MLHTGERRLLWLLAAVVALVALTLGAIRIFGGEIGTPCADS